MHFFDVVQKRDRLSRRFSPVAVFLRYFCPARGIYMAESRGFIKIRPSHILLEFLNLNILFFPQEEAQWTLRVVGNCATEYVASQQLTWFFHPNGAVNFLCTVGNNFPNWQQLCEMGRRLTQSRRLWRRPPLLGGLVASRKMDQSPVNISFFCIIISASLVIVYILSCRCTFKLKKMWNLRLFCCQ